MVLVVEEGIDADRELILVRDRQHGRRRLQGGGVEETRAKVELVEAEVDVGVRGGTVEHDCVGVAVGDLADHLVIGEAALLRWRVGHVNVGVGARQDGAD